MKVLHLYSGNLYGGVETLLVTLAQYRHLCPGMEPHFGLCFEGRLSQELQRSGVSVTLLGKVRTSRPWTIWQARSRLRQLLETHPFDVVICHACWPQAIFGSVVRAAQRPLVFFCHDSLKGQHWLERWAKRVVPDLAIANSRYTQQTLSSLYPQTPSEVFYLPVLAQQPSDPQVIRKTMRASLQTPEDATVIVQAARLEQWKGQAHLLAALAELRELPNWIGWIAGGVQRPQEQAYLQDLRQQATQAGIDDRIRFLGQRSDIHQVLTAADLYCQPNTSPEPFGVVFIEALYAGLPVVTTAMGGALEIVDASCGQLVPPNDVSALAQALRSLITNPTERAVLGKRGPDRANQLCHPATQLNRLLAILDANVATPQPAPPNGTQVTPFSGMPGKP